MTHNFSDLNNRLDQALSRSSSATLQSQRTLSSPTQVSYTSNIAPVQHQNVFSSQVHVASPTYSYASPRLDTSNLYSSISNYQVKTIHDLAPVVRPVPTHYHVEEVRSATYPSSTYTQEVGYDRQKLDHIISRIQGSTPTLQATRILSAPVHEAPESKKSSRPTASNKLEADEESFIKDRKTKNRRAEEEEEEEDQEEEEEQKEVEQESPTKKKNNKQETRSP